MNTAAVLSFWKRLAVECSVTITITLLAGRIIPMTRKDLIQRWQNLSFWKRLAVECSVTITITLLVEVLLSGESGNFVSAVVQGAVFGLLLTIVDHAAVTRKRRGESGDARK